MAVVPAPDNASTSPAPHAGARSPARDSTYTNRSTAPASPHRRLTQPSSDARIGGPPDRLAEAHPDTAGGGDRWGGWRWTRSMRRGSAR
jgi:hypothetical protein